MYIRRTTVKSRESGEPYFTYRLVESVREGEKVRQKTLLNLGRHFNVPPDQWPTLVQCIEKHLHAQEELFDSTADQHLEELGEQYARQLLQRQSEPRPSAPTGDLQTVDVDTIAMVSPRTAGGEYLLLEAMSRLRLDEEFEAYFGSNRRNCMTAIALAVSRALAPGSELASYEWLQQETALGELLGYDFTQISLNRWYRGGDALLARRDDLERHLAQQAQALFGCEKTMVLYDLTNTYFEGTSLGNSLTARGHSKEKRNDCPLVTLALVLDEHGFINRTRVFEGNVSEARTVSTMVEGLRESAPQHDLLEAIPPLVILDAGLATAENVAWLQTRNYRYLVVSRERHRQFDPDAATVVRQAPGNTVRVQRLEDPTTGEIRLYCHSERRESKDRAILDRASERFEEAMSKLNEGLHKKNTTKHYDKVLVRIGRWKEKFARAAQHYTVEVDVDEETGLATAIHCQRQQPTDDTFPGVYCLRTNQIDWDDKALWETYTKLTEIESVFRSLKSELGLRPVHHQIAERITSHLFISVLAYHLIQVIRYTLGQAGIHDSWETLRRLLRRQLRVTVTCRCQDGRTLHVRKSTRAESRLRKIYEAFGISPQAGQVSKTYI